MQTIQGKAKADIEELRFRLNKTESKEQVRGVLESSGMDSGQINLVLKTLDELQDKMKVDYSSRLEDFVPVTTFKALEIEVKVLNKRLTTNEKVVEETTQLGHDNSERLENSRKKIQRLVGEFEALKRKTGSSLAIQQEKMDQISENEPTFDFGDIANATSTEGMQKMVQMLKNVEGNLVKRIASFEGSLVRLEDFQE